MLQAQGEAGQEQALVFEVGDPVVGCVIDLLLISIPLNILPHKECRVLLKNFAFSVPTNNILKNNIIFDV